MSNVLFFCPWNTLGSFLVEELFYFVHFCLRLHGRIEAGFLAARTAIQEYEREATRARHELDEQEMRLSKIKYMRITAEAEAARKRTAQEEERILARERDKHK